MNELLTQIEAILFVESKPVSFSFLAKYLQQEEEKIIESVRELQEMRNTEISGIHVLVHDNAVSLVTNPACSNSVSALLKEEVSGELTRPQLETLTIIAYRGPIARFDIERIRGVNCHIILRNLQMRGLVEEKEGDLVPVYVVTTEFLKTLGLTGIDQLPDYESLRNDERITSLIKEENI